MLRSCQTQWSSLNFISVNGMNPRPLMYSLQPPWHWQWRKDLITSVCARIPQENHSQWQVSCVSAWEGPALLTLSHCQNQSSSQHSLDTKWDAISFSKLWELTTGVWWGLSKFLLSQLSSTVIHEWVKYFIDPIYGVHWVDKNPIIIITLGYRSVIPFNIIQDSWSADTYCVDR